MSENCSAAKQEVGGVSRAFERLLDKITDRFLPDEPENGTHESKFLYIKIPKNLMKGFAISTGISLWFLYGWIHKWMLKFVVQYEEEDKFITSFSDLPPDLEFTFMAISLLFLAFIGVLIFESFNRGRPLSFFFWGLIFPSIALNILEFTFG